MSNTVTLAVPERLIKKAKKMGLNCSEVTRDALKAAIRAKEKGETSVIEL